MLLASNLLLVNYVLRNKTYMKGHLHDDHLLPWN